MRPNRCRFSMVASVLLACGPSPTEVVPQADGTTGPAEASTSTSAGSTTTQAESSGSATGSGADTTGEASTTQGVQPDPSTGELASTGEPGTSTGASPSCDDRFGTALGYIYCTETDMACHFNATTGGGDCNAMCESLGSTCVAAFDNPADPGQECDVIRPNSDTCDTDRTTEICACAK